MADEITQKPYAGPDMKWEIRYATTWTQAQQLAWEGWEFVGVVFDAPRKTEFYYFKRPLDDY